MPRLVIGPVVALRGVDVKDFLKKYGEDMRKEISKEDYDKLYPGMAEMFKQHRGDCDCAICDDIRMTEELEKLSSFRSGVRRQRK